MVMSEATSFRIGKMRVGSSASQIAKVGFL